MAKKTKQEQQIEELAQNIVNTMFNDFQKPNFRGAAFTWEKFPEMMKSLAQSYAPATFYTVSGEKLAVVEKAVGELAFKLAQEKVDIEMFKKSSVKP
jgi:uncharacterized coiled-coil protein SlyX